MVLTGGLFIAASEFRANASSFRYTAFFIATGDFLTQFNFSEID
jgi:hypothetical protein